MNGINAVTTSMLQVSGQDALKQSSFGLNHADTAATPFGSLLSDAVGQVDALEKQAHAAVNGLMTGSGVDVHQAMIATQRADMAFELALSVRNKAVQAYQSVMGMQF